MERLTSGEKWLQAEVLAQRIIRGYGRNPFKDMADVGGLRDASHRPSESRQSFSGVGGKGKNIV